MAVANAWATGHSAVPPPQLLPFSSSSLETGPLSKKKYSVDFPSKILVTRSKNSELACHCRGNIEVGNYGNSSGSCSLSSSSADWDWNWNRWTRHFSEMEQAESYASFSSISGTTGVKIKLLSGLHWYLKYWRGAHISWEKTGGAQLSSIPISGFCPIFKMLGQQ